MKIILRRVLFICLVLSVLSSSGQIFHKNKGSSKTVGKVNNGSIENAWLIPYKGDNFRFFSFFSYYVLGRGYMHSDVCKTLVQSFEELENSLPGYKFRIMDCARKKGGRLLPHRTHQNGMCVDIMLPMKRNGKQNKWFDRIGNWRYLSNVNSKGEFAIDKKSKVDFEALAIQILAMDKAAKKNGLRTKKIILSIDLKDELFATKSGKKLKTTGIYFARNLSPMLNSAHDDHYHVDFELL